jgi:hypothetical protein
VKLVLEVKNHRIDVVLYPESTPSRQSMLFHELLAAVFKRAVISFLLALLVWVVLGTEKKVSL